MIVINRLWLWAYFLLGGMFFLIVYLIIAEIKNSRKRFGMIDGVKLAKKLREAGQGKVKTGNSCIIHIKERKRRGEIGKPYN